MGSDSEVSFNSKRMYVMVERVPSKKQKRCSVQPPLVSTGCCKKKCLSRVDPQAMEKTRTQSAGMSWTQRVQFTYDCINRSIDKNTGKVKVMEFNNEVVCKVAWGKIHGLSKTTLYRHVRHCVTDGAVNAIHGNEGKDKVRGYVLSAMAVLQFYVEEHAKDGNGTTTVNNEVRKNKVLPAGVTQKALLEMVNETQAKMGMKPISCSKLSVLMHTDFKYVQFQK